MRLSASFALLVTIGAGSAAAQTLSVSPTTIAPGGTVTVTVSGGPGNVKDWVGLHVATASDNSYSDWKYLNGTRTAPATGLTSATLSFVMPTTVGDYNFRFFANNTYTKLATSQTVTVQSSGGGPSLGVSTTTATPGQVVTVTVAGGPGNTNDWVGLHQAAGTDSVYSDWKYLSNTRTAPATGLTSASLTFTLPTAAGTYNFRFFRGGNNVKLATSATVTISGSAATLTPSTTTANPGQNVNVTVAGGPGNTNDWVGLHLSTAADATYLDWKYLSGTRTQPATGLTGAVLTFAMPTAPGTYNFRFYRGGNNLKLATSATVTVSGGGVTSLTVSATSANTGQNVSVTVAGGPGNPGDWVALHLSSAGDATYLDWKYLSGTRTRPATGLPSATITFSMPTTAGTYNFRFFRSGNNQKLATSANVVVTGTGGPRVTPNASDVATGANVTVAVANGPGNRGDWVTLNRVDSADNEYSDWKYLNGTRTLPATGSTSASLTFAMPSPGTYNFRFLRAGDNARLALSTSVIVQGPSSLTLNATSAAPGQTVTVSFVNGARNPRDWIALHSATAPDTTYLDWKYLNNTRTIPASGLAQGTVNFAMPATPGPYNFRLYRNGTSTKLATSPNVSVISGAPSLSIADVNVTEGNAGTSNVTLTLSLSAPSTQTVTVNYATTNGTATTADYVPASGILSLTAGALTRTFTITVRGDTDFEPNENFFVDLTNNVNAAISDSRAVVTILNDDQGPPVQPTLIAPSGTITTATPQYQWNRLSDALDYLLVVYRPGSAPVIQQTFTQAAACPGAVCSVTPATALARGPYKWILQARNAVGSGPFSLPLAFTVNAGTAGVVTVNSHSSGQQVPARGFIVSGTATDPGGVTALTATLDDSLLGRTVDARPLEIASGSGRWAFWVREGQVTSGETATISLNATYNGGQTSATTLTLQVVPSNPADYAVVNRLTFGATPELLERIAAIGPAAFIDEQLNPGSLDDSVLTARLTGMARTTKEQLQAYALTRMIFSRRQLLEVMTQFWDNHFSTDINKTNNVTWESNETDRFRSNALGKFRDLLDVSSTSPAMMIYLDNASSLAQEPNENYARELMELHTMGVDGGYTQRDVEQVARAFTGWGVQGSAFFFNLSNHITTQKTVLGNTLPAGRGLEDGRQVLDILTAHPSTARFICKKLIQLFVSDTPPQGLWDSCRATFTSSEGDIGDVVRVILTSPEFSTAQYLRAKVKTPLELVASFVRATDASTSAADLSSPMGDMGMRLYEKDEPTGWSETGDDWINSNLLLERTSWVNDVVRRSPAAGRTTVSLKSFFSANGYETAEGIVGFLFDLSLHHEFTDLDRQVALDILSPSGQAAFDFNAPEADARLQRLVGTVLSYPGYQVQ